jgi:hypothetical protein
VTVAISIAGLCACGGSHESAGARATGQTQPRGAGTLQGPTLSPPVGGFASTGFQRGLEAVALSAADPRGITDEQALIDGAVVGGAVQCPASSGAFGCLGHNRSISRQLLAVNTAKFSDGSHTCGVIVHDALGGSAKTTWDCRIDNTRPTAMLSRAAADGARAVQFAGVTDAGAGLDPDAFAPQYSADQGHTWHPLAGGSYDPGAQMLSA